MFDKLKQLKELKEIEGRLKEEKVEVEESGVKIVMNGKMQIEKLSLNPELSFSDQEKAVKKCFEKAVKEIQLKLAKAMSGFGF